MFFRFRHRSILPVLMLLLLLTACGGGEDIPRVRNAGEAIETLAENAGEWGYLNAFSELTEVSTTVSGEHTFYRLQQNFHGIPVYGQHVVYVTDGEGHCQVLAENVRDLPEDLDLTPTVSAELVEAYVADYLYRYLSIGKILTPVEVDLSECSLYIYDQTALEDDLCLPGFARLVYEVIYQGHRFLADAETGEILHHNQFVSSDSAPATLAESGESFNAILTSDGSYAMADTDLRMYLFDAGKRTFWNCHNDNLNFDILTPVTSPDNVFGDDNDSTREPETAEAVYRVMRDIRTFYREELGENNVHNLMVVYNDRCANFGHQAGGGCIPIPGREYLFPELDTSEDGLLMGLVTLGTDYAGDIENLIDVAAHEYTHAVSRWVVDWADSSEQNEMLDEAFSDIFGELIEAHTLGTDPDWEIASRNIHDPASEGYPVRAYDPTPEGDRIHGGSTVISHTAYLMWNGMDGTDSKKIPTDQLAELWYKALLMMPSNADFTTCRGMVLRAAHLMNLTTDQIACIKEAFDNAQVGSSYVHYTAGTSFRVNVLDAIPLSDPSSPYQSYNLVPCPKYELTVQYAWDTIGPMRPTAAPIVHRGSAQSPCHLTLNPGYYRIDIRHDGSETVTNSFLVQVCDGGADTLDISLDWGYETFECSVYAYPRAGETWPGPALSNARVGIYDIRTRELVQEWTIGPDAEKIEATIMPGDYLLRVEAEGYVTYEEEFHARTPYATQKTVNLTPISEPVETEPTEATSLEDLDLWDPTLVSLEPDQDYGVYPFPEHFIIDTWQFVLEGKRPDDYYHVYDTGPQGYEIGEPDIITSPNPYYWWWGVFAPSLEPEITEYLELLEQEPFCLELIHTKDMGDEWIYIYRYTGKHEVYPLNISGYIPEDGGEYHLAVDISKRATYRGNICLEIIAGYGLERINPDTLEDILQDFGYLRTSNSSESLEGTDPSERFYCYFCSKEVYSTAENPLEDQQIIYCDSCYEEMFGDK